MSCDLDKDSTSCVLAKGNLKTLHKVLGLHDFKTPLKPPPSLIIRLRNITDPTKLTFNLDITVTTNDAEDAAAKLMLREYPNIENPKSATVIP